MNWLSMLALVPGMCTRGAHAQKGDQDWCVGRAHVLVPTNPERAEGWGLALTGGRDGCARVSSLGFCSRVYF